MGGLERAKGILFGLAIGDALGYPTEFMTLGAIKARYGPQGIFDLPEPALFSDDTQMTLAVTEALVEAGDRVQGHGHRLARAGDPREGTVQHAGPVRLALPHR